MLKSEHLASVKKLELIDRQEMITHSPTWLAAMATIDAEIAQKVAKLAKTHHVRVSSVTGRGNPGFTMSGSDEDAKSMAHEADVESVESLGAADELIENVTMGLWQ